MGDALYKLGFVTPYLLMVIIALFCINKIRKNRAEIKKLEAELEREERNKK